MISRLAIAFRKLLFCFRISANFNTFLKLLINTKRLRWYKESNKRIPHNEPIAAYLFTINNKKHTFYLRTYEGDIDIFYEIFWRKIYELPPNQMQPCKVIVDIGANVGLAALYFATHYTPSQIICIEPGEANYALLKKNCSMYKNIKTMQAAVMPDDGWCLIKEALLQYNNKVEFTTRQQNSVQAISMQTLFTIFNLTFIDLLKIDIEGAEEAVFSADTHWLDKVNQVLIEIHSLQKNNASFTAFQQHSFTVASVKGNVFSESVYWAINNQQPGDRLMYVI